MPDLIGPSALARLEGRERLLVGFSGGLDSTVLLHLCAHDPAFARSTLSAIHVHHGLHPQADAWAAHCAAACEAWGVPLRIVRVHVPRDAGDGLEAAARAARHAAFADAIGEDDVLALAHHRGDQAETFLLRALRASGPDGLGAMRAWRAFGRGRLWRPLLDTSQSALRDYAQRHGLRWMEDPANADHAFDRNFLRQRVLPLLRARWPGVDDAFARSAALSAEAAALLSDEDARALAAARGADANLLCVDALRAIPAERRARALRRWIAELGLPALPAAGIARIESDLMPARGDSGACFAWSNARIRRWRDLLHAGRDQAPLPRDWSVAWDGREALALPGGGTLVLQGAAAFDTPLRVHARRGGERLVLPGRGHSHALKHVLQDTGAPPWLRARMPLLSDADGVLLAAGDRIRGGAFDAWLQARGASLAWRLDSPSPTDVP